MAEVKAPNDALDTDEFLDGVIAAAEALGLGSDDVGREDDFEEEAAADLDAA